MQVINRKTEIGFTPAVHSEYHASENEITISKVSEEEGIEVFKITASQASTKTPILIKWKLPAINVKGSWTTNNILDKRFKTDWEDPMLNASISVDAPIINMFGHADENIATVAMSDLVNLILIEGSLREEDNHIHFKLQLFTDCASEKDFESFIYIDKRQINFSKSIQECSQWMIEASQIVPHKTSALAKVPLYSTWYTFHQNLDEASLLEECRLSKSLGYDLIIIDDGWQTMDDNRGYDFTGDWEAIKIKPFESFVEKVHNTGMGIMLWYSVPFCGVKSKAYQKFKGKFLTENHHWAPVLDPRFPEVRSHLVELYAKALLDWNLDGFKLDFIDDFKVYPETETKHLNGRDTLSVAQGVFKLINEISKALTTIKPNVLIEFRQQYINPGLRILGNMFRAFDCPNDSLMNRVRTVDVKLLCGNSAVHSDMLTWHKDEPVEIAALQLTNCLFSVPQISVRLAERSEEEKKMIQFYTYYWNENKDTLLEGEFTAYKPLSNYPILKSKSSDLTIFGIYDDLVLDIDMTNNEIHIINGKLSSSVIIKSEDPPSNWSATVYNHVGDQIRTEEIILKSIQEVDCPPNGMIKLLRTTS